MRRITRYRRLIPTVVSITTFFSFVTNNSASAHEFQEHAAINDDKNEIVDDHGMTRTLELDASKPEGSAIGVLKGQQYRLEISGTFVYAAGNGPDGKPARIADAECAIDPVGDRNTGRQWQSERFKGWGSDLLDVLLTNPAATGFKWLPADPYPPLSIEGELGCSKTNTYYADIKPADWWLRFKVDDRFFTDNIGSVKIALTRGAFTTTRIYEGKAYQCPKWTEEGMQAEPGTVGSILHADLMIDSKRTPRSIPNPAATDLTGNRLHRFNDETGHWGMYTCNWELPDTTYRIVVDGVWKYNRDEGELALADAECATGAMEYEAKWEGRRTDTRGPEAWMDRRYVETTSSGQVIDNLDLMINRDTNQDVKWTPMYPDPANPACAGDTNHTYYLDFKPDRTGPIRFNVGDWDYYEEDNKGMLCIHIERLGAKPHSHEVPANNQSHEVLTPADFMPGLGG